MPSLTKLLIGVAAFALPGSLAAQQMTAGTWTGTVSPPDQGALDATFNVRASGDTTKITINVAGRQFEATGVKIEPKQLLFTFSPGNATVSCTLLLKDDKSYSGNCADPQGGSGVITMKPPAK